MNAQPNDFTSQRLEMVRSQLEDRRITDAATLQAMRTVKRELFVPERYKKYAYRDGPLPIGYDQTISQPYIVAFMVSTIHPKPTDRVLEIGTGSGYQAAVLGEIVAEVYTIEIVDELGAIAMDRLDSLGYDNVHVRLGDGYHGWPEAAPFDAILVTAAPEEVPQPLIDQLREGGRLVIPVGSMMGVQELLLLTKKKGKITRERLLPVRFVPFTREN